MEVRGLLDPIEAANFPLTMDFGSRSGEVASVAFGIHDRNTAIFVSIVLMPASCKSHPQPLADSCYKLWFLCSSKDFPGFHNYRRLTAVPQFGKAVLPCYQRRSASKYPKPKCRLLARYLAICSADLSLEYVNVMYSCVL